MPTKTLNYRQQLFVNFYTSGNGERGNAYKSAIKAGYTHKYANNGINNLLGNVGIKAAIKEKQRVLAEKCNISAEAQIKETVELRNNAKQSNHYTAALTANDQLNRHIGFYNADTSQGLSIVDIMAVVGIAVEASDKP